CELAFADGPAAAALTRAGLNQVRAAPLYGCGRSWLDEPAAEGPRDIDVLFVGNLQAAVQRERLPWLGRLARLAERWRVVIATGTFGDDYWKLMRRARIVFNRSVRGECNKRGFEAAAAGALLFQEREYLEIRESFHGEE